MNKKQSLQSSDQYKSQYSSYTNQSFSVSSAEKKKKIKNRMDSYIWSIRMYTEGPLPLLHARKMML